MKLQVFAVLLLSVAAVHATKYPFPGTDLTGDLGSDGVMDLVKVTQPSDPNAKCLDGTSPGYYLRKGNTDKWVIFIQGGGWCYNADDCLARSKTRLGSSNPWPAQASGQGVMSANQTTNPDFFSWSVAYLQYCDGASFAGNNATAQDVNGTTIYYRGRPILTSLLEDLRANQGMKSATDVLLGGCSAGGLATYLHADYVSDFVHGFISNDTTVKAMPVSGYFMDLPTMANEPLYPSEMKWVFEAQNMTNGVNQGCIAANPLETYKCVFAQNNYPYIKTPLFILNSLYDSWQAGNIWKPAGSCAGKPSTCTTEDMEFANAYRAKMLAAMTTTQKWMQPDSGAFVHSCWSHCLGRTNAGWAGVTSSSGLLMRDAVKAWYYGVAPSATHTTDASSVHVRVKSRSQIHLPRGMTSDNDYEIVGCELPTTAPYKCNPTCPVA